MMDYWFDKLSESENRGGGGNQGDWTVRARVAYGNHDVSLAHSAGRWVTGKGRTFFAALEDARKRARW